MDVTDVGYVSGMWMELVHLCAFVLAVLGLRVLLPDSYSRTVSYHMYMISCSRSATRGPAGTC